MDLDQLNGRYRRLKDELARAHAQEPWPTGQIDRLIEEISAAKLAIAAIGPRALATADSSTVPTSAGKSTTRTPSVPRNRLTPFGAPAPQPSGE